MSVFEIPYKDQDERTAIIAKEKLAGNTLIEDSIQKDVSVLIFGIRPVCEVTLQSLSKKVAELEKMIVSLGDAESKSIRK